MAYKKLIPGLACKAGRAFILNYMGFATTPCPEDILTISQYYSDSGADALYIYDGSDTDEDHEKTIATVKAMARLVDIPLIAGGYVKRLEDVKKYLYAGAKAVFLNVCDEDNLDLLKEAADRFGGEKIYAYISKPEYMDRIEEFAQLGASVMILDVPGLSHENLQQVEELGERCLVVTYRDAEETAVYYMDYPSVEGFVFNLPMKEAENCMVKKQKLKALGVPVNTLESSVSWGEFKLNSDGLIPVIVQDYKTSEVLMMAYMNENAYEATLQSGKMTYFSRSRQKLWLKGATSGHYQYVKSLKLDCDHDTVLAKVRQAGSACHTGARSCFFQTLAERAYRETNPLKVFEDVFQVILDRKEHPREGSYTNYLFDKGIDKILKKVGEEATEIIIAAKNPDPEEIKYEISDFLYHIMVLMAEKGVTWEEITEELANR